MMQITFRKSLLAALLSGTVAFVTPALAGSLIVAQSGPAGSSGSVNATTQSNPSPGSPATNPDNATGTYGGMNSEPSQTMMKKPNSNAQPPLSSPYGNSAGGAFGNTTKGPPPASAPQTTQPHP